MSIDSNFEDTVKEKYRHNRRRSMYIAFGLFTLFIIIYSADILFAYNAGDFSPITLAYGGVMTSLGVSIILLLDSFRFDDLAKIAFIEIHKSLSHKIDELESTIRDLKPKEQKEDSHT